MSKPKAPKLKNAKLKKGTKTAEEVARLEAAASCGMGRGTSAARKPGAGLWWRKPGPGLQRSQHSPLRHFTCQLFSGPTADPLQPPIRGAFRNVQRASGGPQRCLGESKQRWRTGGREGATTGPRRSINC